MAANIPFITHNLYPRSFMDVPEDLYVNVLLGIYELNRIALMREVFVWTYERSCARYQAIRHTIGEQDTFRLHYQKVLIDCAGEIIRQAGSGRTDDPTELLSRMAINLIHEHDLEKFLEVANEEIKTLHAGNYARYRLPPKEFQAWQKYRK